MPAPLTEDQRAHILALIAEGKSDRKVASEAGVSRHSVMRVRQSEGIEAQPHIGHQSGPSALAVARAIGDIGDAHADVATRIRGMSEKAAAVLEDALDDPLARPHPQRVKIALWVLERSVASADAKEQTVAAQASATAYASAIAAITAPDEELDRRMSAIEDAQDAIVAARQPHVLTDPDVVEAA